MILGIYAGFGWYSSPAFAGLPFGSANKRINDSLTLVQMPCGTSFIRNTLSEIADDELIGEPNGTSKSF